MTFYLLSDGNPFIMKRLSIEAEKFMVHFVLDFS